MKSTLFDSKTKAILCSGILCLGMLFAQSCVDKAYDWDDMDKSGVFNIPPIMMGDIDIIYLHELQTGILPDGFPATGFEIVLTDTINGMFEGDAIEDFFFDGAGEVKFEAKVDIAIAKLANTRIMLYFNVIDYNDNKINGVVIPGQELSNGNNQALAIKIASQYMKYMEDAKSLEITIVVAADNGTVQISEGDYIFLKSVIVKTGGYRFEL